MFTGLVAGQGEILRALRRGAELGLTVRLKFAAGDLAVGESISVNGVCLTAESVERSGFTAYASAETASRSTLGGLKIGALVNIERALRLGDRLGGHLVSGHVDAAAEVTAVSERGASREVWFAVPPELAPQIAAKGSVCLDGVSLTVNACEEARFSVNIIPETLRATTAKDWRPGGKVNLETDMLAKYVQRCLGLAHRGRADTARGSDSEEPPGRGREDGGPGGVGQNTAFNGSGLTLDFLHKHGF